VNADPPKLEVGRSIAQGGAWMIALRWAMRLLGLANTLVLARLLTPADFGLVAMAMLVVGLVEVLGQTGQMLALIRHPAPTREHYDSVWTLTLIVAALLTVVLWLVAPAAPLYFGEPRATGLIQVLALRTLIGGFENIGVIAFRKNLEFGKEFRFQLLQRVSTVLATLACALWLGDYRALIVGILLGRVLGVALSYILHPYRPRLCVAKIPEMLAFSGWMLVVHLASHCNERADEMIVGAVAEPAMMGEYNVAKDLATAPTQEVILPVIRALFPVFARIGGDAQAVRAAFLDVFAASCLISMAVGTGMALVAEDFVAVALGPQWTSAVTLVQILALGGALSGCVAGIPSVLGAIGHSRLSARLSVTRAVTMLLGVAAASQSGGLHGIAVTGVLVTLVFLPGALFAVGRVLPISTVDVLRRVWRPLTAAVTMALMITEVHLWTPSSPLLRLPLEVAVGAATYGIAVLVLWMISGRPAGLEAAIYDWTLRRLSGRTRQA
jgi:O-antigen/teichoic acid export membrane protein